MTTDYIEDCPHCGDKLGYVNKWKGKCPDCGALVWVYTKYASHYWPDTMEDHHVIDGECRWVSGRSRMMMGEE